MEVVHRRQLTVCLRSYVAISEVPAGPFANSWGHNGALSSPPPESSTLQWTESDRHINTHSHYYPHVVLPADAQEGSNVVIDNSTGLKACSELIHLITEFVVGLACYSGTQTLKEIFISSESTAVTSACHGVCSDTLKRSHSLWSITYVPFNQSVLFNLNIPSLEIEDAFKYILVSLTILFLTVV